MKKNFLPSAIIFFACAFAACSALFYLVAALLPHEEFGKILFISRSPQTLLLYIGLLCLPYCLLAARLQSRVARKNRQNAALLALICILVPPVIASPVYGVLLEVPRVYAGCYPGTMNALQQLAAGGLLGIIGGFMHPVLLFPYSFVCAAAGVPGTVWLSRQLHQRCGRTRASVPLH